ncbi:MAG: Gfo/Idh/MocA family protein [Acetobacteraceae bacterium]
MTPPDTTKIAVGVVGSGHFGRFHALKAAQEPRFRLIGVADKNDERARAVGAEAGAPALSWPALLAAAEALVIATPADSHFALARQAIEAGRHVLVEKPIAATLAEADILATLAERRATVLQVGHLERFSAAFRALVPYMQRPLYIEAVRIAPFKERGTDVSVVLDLMIHDLDLVLALVGCPIATVDAVGAPVASPHEDLANARLRFVNGCVATITASRVSFRTERRMRLFAETGYVSVDFAKRRLSLISRAAGGTALPGLPGFSIAESAWEDHDSLAAEHAAFAAAIKGEAPVVVDAKAGRAALAAALMVANSMAESRARAAASGLLTPGLLTPGLLGAG